MEVGQFLLQRGDAVGGAGGRLFCLLRSLCLVG